MSLLRIDRSRVVARQDCEMLRYLSYHCMGMGITLPVPKQALLVGLVIHKGIETLFKTNNDLDKALNEAGGEYARQHEGILVDVHTYSEQWTLIKGLLIGFSRIRMPQLLDEYEVVELEQEHEVELVPGVVLMLRFDAVLRRKADGLIVLLDYKTLGYVSDDWSKNHEISLQTLLYTWAASKLFNVDQSSVAIQYEGLVKGLHRKDTAKSSAFFGRKVQQSPLCYAYHFPEAGVWNAEYTSAKGWKKVAVWDTIGLDKWVNLLEETGKLAELFPVIPPVMPTLADKEAAVNSVVTNELEFAVKLTRLHDSIKLSVEMGMDPEEARVYWERRLFEQNRGRCYKYGIDNGCPMTGYCFNATASESPFEVGGFEKREPHHAGEMTPTSSGA